MNNIRTSSTALQAATLNNNSNNYNNINNNSDFNSFGVNEHRDLSFDINQSNQNNLIDNNFNFTYQNNIKNYKQNTIIVNNNINNQISDGENNNGNTLVFKQPINHRNRSFIIEKKLTIPSTANNSNLLRLINDDSVLLKSNNINTDNKPQKYRSITLSRHLHSSVENDNNTVTSTQLQQKSYTPLLYDNLNSESFTKNNLRNAHYLSKSDLNQKYNQNFGMFNFLY